MTPILKRIIAREGLIVVGYIGWLILANYTPYEGIDFEISQIVTSALISINGVAYLEEIWRITNTIIYSPYPLYLTIRFLIWAIKTLKEKHEQKL